jgi:SNF2 family DNA or RNA helicase
VNELLEDGEKVVVMTVFRKEMDMLKEYYGDKAVCYRGGMTVKQKDSAQDAFNNDNNVKVFLGNIIASGTGISLPVSRKIVFNNFEWNYSDNVQAESRIHRLTQTRDVECIYMLFNDSISEEMFDKVLYKGYLMDETIKSENEKK